MLYTLNLHNVICQVYPNKPRKKECVTLAKLYLYEKTETLRDSLN